MRVVVVGGGISGLSTAFYVKQHRPDWEVTLLERNPRLGGTMGTEEVDGFRFEQGSNGFLSNKPDTLDLAAALNNMGSALLSLGQIRRATPMLRQTLQLRRQLFEL